MCATGRASVKYFVTVKRVFVKELLSLCQGACMIERRRAKYEEERVCTREGDVEEEVKLKLDSKREKKI